MRNRIKEEIMRTRQQALQHLKTLAAGQPIVIVGAGINGIGVYRDLALQGVATILIDKGDFSSGTSAAPSRLIHGGLRYLETGEFALVKESVIERNHLLRNAPHLVRPLPVWVPAFSWFGGMLSAGLRFLKLKKTPGAKGILAVKLGLTFFDNFGKANQVMPNHRLLSSAERRARLPRLSGKVCAVAQYYDARLLHPERLALELIKDAERDCPDAIAVPYLSLASTSKDMVTLRDEISGETMQLTPKLVINCAGAWADDADGRLSINRKLIGGTRGSHLVLKRPDIAGQIGDGMLYFETRDFRACLVYALDKDCILIGTTDVRASDPDNATCSEEEITYLFDVIEQILPGTELRREEIVFAYSGIRPLPHSDDESTGAISRDHALHVFEADDGRSFPVLTLVGGKWTTYRACAEQISDAVLARLGRKRLETTLKRAIGGGAGLDGSEAAMSRLADGIVRRTGIDPARAAKLVARYGSQANEVADVIASGHAHPLGCDACYLDGEIEWILSDERVTRLIDIIMRRTLLPFENALSTEVIAEIAAIAAGRLGWDEARTQSEIHQTRATLTSRNRVKM